MVGQTKLKALGEIKGLKKEKNCCDREDARFTVYLVVSMRNPVRLFGVDGTSLFCSKHYKTFFYVIEHPAK
jgi:hypothetical protein